MPVQECQTGGKPGYRWGDSGKCYTHDGTDAGRRAAKQLAVKQAVAIGGGTIRNELADDELSLLEEVERAYAELETVDLDGVEIMAAVGPVKGIGSAPGGDHWTPDDLRGMAQAASELAGEVTPPATIGHFPKFSDPAVGHLQNLRVNDDASKLIADVKGVPRRFADLIKAKAYGSRSVDLLGKLKSQKTGKTYPWVVTGLAWGGGKLPAVRTLDDVPLLYEGEGERFVQLEEFDLGEVPVERLLEAVYDQASTIAVLASGLSRDRVDSRPTVGDKTYTDEQRRKFADATGLEAEKVTDEVLANAGVPVEEEKPKEEPVALKLEDEALRALTQKTEEAAERSRKLEEELRVERRDSFIENDAIKTGKIEPGQREYIELMYDASPEKARKYVESLDVQEHLVREYGSDEADLDDDAREKKLEQEERAYEEEHERIYGEKPMQFGRAA